MNPYDEVVVALKALIVRSSPQLGQVIVLTEKNLSMMRGLMERLGEDSSLPLAKRIRSEVPGAGDKFHTVTIKFPDIGACEISLDDLNKPNRRS